MMSDGKLKQKHQEDGSVVKLSKQEIRQKEFLEKSKSKKKDLAKIVLAILVVALGVWGFYFDLTWPVYVRALIPILGVVSACAIIFLWCDLGKSLIRYIKDSVTEVKKVVWPTKNETWKNTIFVLLFTLVMTIFLWGVDAILAWLFLLNA